MEVPEILFTKSGEVNIAYQSYGSGPDLVVVPPLISNVEIQWETELWRRLLEFNGERFRVLHFDKRGIGISDRFEQKPTLEQRIGDIIAVMDAEGVERAHVMGMSEGGIMAQLFAAMHPERVDRLVLLNSLPGVSIWDRLGEYSDEPVLSSKEAALLSIRLAEDWGRDPTFFLENFVPSQKDNSSFARWMARFQRQSATPADIRRQIESVMTLDATDRLSDIKAPTLVLHAARDRVSPVAAGRYLAAKIPGAELIEIDSDDHFCWTDGNWRTLAGHWTRFLTGEEPARRSERKFATVLFTDIVQSTARAGEIGDEAWRRLLESHDRLAWKTIDAHRGSVVKGTGDGLLAVFDSPSDAVACAGEFRKELDGIGLAIRGGLHVGEIVVRDDGDVSGLAVNLAARVLQKAEAGAIYASSTVRDMLLGGERTFADKGEHELKGIDGAWRLYELSN